MPSSPFGPSERDLHPGFLVTSVVLASSVITLLVAAELAAGALGLVPLATPRAALGPSSGTTSTRAVVPPLFPVVFAETGLPPGTNWSVTLNGLTESSTTDPSVSTAARAPGSSADEPRDTSSAGFVRELVGALPTGSAAGTTITFQEPVGTYPFTVGRVPGYSPDPSSGRATVTAPSVSESITFSATSSTAPSGLPVLSATTGYYLLGALAGVAVVIVVVELALRSRQRRQPVETDSWASL